MPNIPSLEIYDRPSGLDTLLKVGLLSASACSEQLSSGQRQVSSGLDILLKVHLSVPLLPLACPHSIGPPRQGTYS